MHRFIPGLTKPPEKRKITQTDKRQRDCVYDRSKRNRGISRNGRSTHSLLTTTKIMQCFALRPFVGVVAVAVGKIPVQLESGEIMRSGPMKAGLVVSDGLVNF